MYDNKVLIMLEDAGSMTSYVPYFKIISELQQTWNPGSLVIIGKSRYLAVEAISRSCNSGISSILDAVIRSASRFAV
ncbi:MAG: hypothetical protein K8R07_01355 [Desulfobacterales bacterium]|nr:hypothetical protein [Desulfobacterales bacterium]